MRLSAIGAALLSALFLLLGTGVAHADPQFVLAQSEAGPGDSVLFSISGTESRATYSVEVDGEEVAEGSAPAGGEFSGGFTMPDLGDTSRSVTVEAQITQSEETTTRARNLRYVISTPASPGPTATQHASDPTPAPAAQSAPASAPPPRSQSSRQQARRRAGGKPRLRRSPRRARQHTREPRPIQRRTSGGQLSTRGGDQNRRRVSRSSTPAIETSPAAATPPSTGNGGLRSTSKSNHRPSGGSSSKLGLGSAAPLATALTGPPRTPAIFSLTSGIIGTESGGVPIAAAAAMPALLALAALALVGLRPVRRWGPTRVETEEADGRDQIARRYLYVPGPGGLAGSTASDSSAVDTLAPPNGWPAPVLTPPEDQEAPLLLDDAGIEAISSFAPISLAALDRRAGLATRSESKYILDTRTFERLLDELSSHYLVLDIDGGRVFLYDTIYFDTPTQTIYRHHVQGRRRRFKCRTRLYSANGPCFFEVKLKGGRGETIKRRFEVDIGEHGLFTPHALAFLERELNQAYGVSSPADLAPVLRTIYRRLTLVSRVDSERLTFDLELTFGVNDKRYSIQTGRILLETKAGTGGGAANQGLSDENGRPWEANGSGSKTAEGATEGALEAHGSGGEGNGGTLDAGKVLQRLGARPIESCSKYCIGVALAHPELRNNPFRRLIRLHFESDRHPRRRADDRQR